MEEEFVPYQEALNLKELGFNEPCISRYCIVTEWEKPTGKILLQQTNCTLSDKNLIKAPLYQQAFRWLYKKLNIEKGIMPLDTESQQLLLKELIENVKSKL
jgi:hypothetical protein